MTAALAIDNWLTRLANNRPDEATRRYFDYREQHVYPYLSAKGLRLVRRQNQDAAPARVHSAASLDEIVFITGTAHGTPTAVLGGSAGVTAFSVGEFPDTAVAGKIVHLAACLCARSLGPEMVRRGARAFLGYDSFLQFPGDELEERAALPAMELDAMIDRLLVDGKSVGDVFELAQEWAAAECFRLARAGRVRAAANLRQNASMLQRIGDESAYLQLH